MAANKQSETKITSRDRFEFVKYASGVRKRLNEGSPIMVTGFLPLYDYRLDEEAGANLIRQWSRNSVTKLSGTGQATADIPINLTSLDQFMCFGNLENPNALSWGQRYAYKTTDAVADSIYVDLETDIPYKRTKFYNVGGSVIPGTNMFTNEKPYFYYTTQVTNKQNGKSELLASNTKLTQLGNNYIMECADNILGDDGIWEMGGNYTSLGSMTTIDADAEAKPSCCTLLNRNVYQQVHGTPITTVIESPSSQNKCSVGSTVVGTSVTADRPANVGAGAGASDGSSGNDNGNGYLRDLLTVVNGNIVVRSEKGIDLYDDIYMTRSSVNPDDGVSKTVETMDSYEYRLTIRRHVTNTLPAKERKKINKVIIFYQTVEAVEGRFVPTGDYLPYAIVVFPTHIIGEGGVDALSIRFTNVIADNAIANIYLDTNDWVHTSFDQKISVGLKSTNKADESEVISIHKPVLRANVPVQIGTGFPESNNADINHLNELGKLNVATANISDYYIKRNGKSKDGGIIPFDYNTLYENESAIMKVFDMRKTAYGSNNTSLEWQYHTMYDQSKGTGNAQTIVTDDFTDDSEKKEIKPSATVWKITNTSDVFSPLRITEKTIRKNQKADADEPVLPLRWAHTANRGAENRTGPYEHAAFHHFVLGNTDKVRLSHIDEIAGLFDATVSNPAFWMEVAMIRTRGIYTGLVSAGQDIPAEHGDLLTNNLHLGLLATQGNWYARGEMIYIGNSQLTPKKNSIGLIDFITEDTNLASMTIGNNVITLTARSMIIADGNVTIKGALGAGDAAFSKTLTVAGNATLATLSVNGATNLIGLLTGTSASLSSNLSVTGTTTLTGALTGTSATLRNDLSVSGNTAFRGIVSPDGTQNAAWYISAMGSASFFSLHATHCIFGVKETVSNQFAIQILGGIRGDNWNIASNGDAMFTSITVPVTLYAAASGAGITPYTNISTSIIDAIRRLGNSLVALSERTANVSASSISPGSATKVTYNASGIITSGTALVANDIPNIDAGKISTGTLNVDRIPNINASKITSGTLPIARGGTGWEDSVTTRCYTLSSYANYSDEHFYPLTFTTQVLDNKFRVVHISIVAIALGSGSAKCNCNYIDMMVLGNGHGDIDPFVKVNANGWYNRHEITISSVYRSKHALEWAIYLRGGHTYQISTDVVLTPRYGMYTAESWITTPDEASVFPLMSLSKGSNSNTHTFVESTNNIATNSKNIICMWKVSGPVAHPIQTVFKKTMTLTTGTTIEILSTSEIRPYAIRLQDIDNISVGYRTTSTWVSVPDVRQVSGASVYLNSITVTLPVAITGNVTFTCIITHSSNLSLAASDGAHFGG